MADVSFSVVARDFASRTLREVGNAALVMAAKVNAANKAMADGWERNTQLSRGWFNAILYGAPLVPPLLGAITVGVGALGSAVVSVAPGVAALGLALGGLFKQYGAMDKQIQAAQKAVENTTPGTDAHKQAVGQLRDLQSKAHSGLFGQGYGAYNDTKGAIQQAQQQAQSTTVPISIEGMKALQDLLPKLQPLIKSFGAVFQHALEQVRAGINSAGFDKFLHWASTVGALNFSNILKALGNLGITIGNLAMAFSGPGAGFTKWLADVTGKWREWSSTLSSNQGFQNFIKYVNTNAPLLGKALGNLITFIGRFVVALGPLGHLELVGLVNLTNLLNKMPTNVLTVVATGFVLVTTAAKTMGVVTGIVTGVTTAINFMKDAAIGTRIGLIALAISEKAIAIASGLWTAAQWALNIALDANPIGLIIIAIAAFVAGIILAYKHSETFRNIVDAVGQALKTAFQWGMEKAKEFFNWLTGTFFPNLSRGWSVLSADFQRGLGVMTRIFSTLWNVAIHPYINLILASFQGLMTMWGRMLLALSHVPGFGWAKGAAEAMFHAADAAGALRAKIDALHSKSITVHTTFSETTIKTLIEHHTTDKPGGNGGKFNPNLGYAAGGRTPAFRDFMVGEEGPEMLRLPVPAQVYTRHQVQSLAQDHRSLGGGGTGGTVYANQDGIPIEVHIHLEGQTIVRTILAHKRNKGGRDLGIA